MFYLWTWIYESSWEIWKKLELAHKKVNARTLLQIRSHAQKVFLNISNNDIDVFIGFKEKIILKKSEN